MLSHEELLRYSRHLTLPDVGLEGQTKIGAARVLLVGAGGLGSPAAQHPPQQRQEDQDGDNAADDQPRRTPALLAFEVLGRW